MTILLGRANRNEQDDNSWTGIDNGRVASYALTTFSRMEWERFLWGVPGRCEGVVLPVWRWLFSDTSAWRGYRGRSKGRDKRKNKGRRGSGSRIRGSTFLRMSSIL